MFVRICRRVQFKPKNGIIQCSLPIWGRQAIDRSLILVITNRLLSSLFLTHMISVKNKIVAFAEQLKAAVSAPLYNYNFA